jgi:hypothetical protein
MDHLPRSKVNPVIAIVLPATNGMNAQWIAADWQV